MKDALWENIIAFYRRYYVITRERLVPALLIHHLNRTVGSFSETKVSIKFRFRKWGQLQLLCNNLRVPKIFRFIDDNGKSHGRVRGEEAFLIGLACLSSQHLPILFPLSVHPWLIVSRIQPFRPPACNPFLELIPQVFSSEFRTAVNLFDVKFFGRCAPLLMQKKIVSLF